MVQAGFNQGYELFFVPREAARNKCAAQPERRNHRVDGLLFVDLALFGLAADIGRSGKLPFGKTVYPVVLDDVEHIQVSPQRVRELPKADGKRIPIAGYADAVKTLADRVRAGSNRGHAPMHGVDTVGRTQEISRCLRGTADSREFGDLVRRRIELEEGLNQCRADGIMSTSGTKRRDRALVVPHGESQTIPGLTRIVNPGLGDECHAAALCLTCS